LFISYSFEDWEFFFSSRLLTEPFTMFRGTVAGKHWYTDYTVLCLTG